MLWMRFSLAVGVALAIAGSTRADSVQLTNGDLLNGEVVSLDARELKLKSEIHGQMIIARGKVAAVAFGEKNLLTDLADAARAAAKQAANDRAELKSERVARGGVQNGGGNASAPGTSRPGVGVRDPLSGAAQYTGRAERTTAARGNGAGLGSI